MKLFAEHFGMGPADAHKKTHILIDKQSFILPIERVEKANEVISPFTEIEALCRLVEPA